VAFGRGEAVMKFSTRDAGKVGIVDLKGRVVLGSGDLALREAVQKILDAGKQKILLNLKEVDYIDSAGIGELVACKKRATAKGGDVRLLMPKGTVYNVLSMVGLHLVFKIEDEEAKAVGSF
jgi:anti-sigma B factor antagonist